MKALTTLFVIGMFLTTLAMADDVDDEKAAVLKFYEQLNSEDPAYSDFYLVGGNVFPRTSLLLQPFNVDRRAAKTNFDAGLDFDVQIRHLDAKVYGSAAVVTYYTSGSTKYADGTVLRGVFRASQVWIKQGTDWKYAHGHYSPLQSQP